MALTSEDLFAISQLLDVKLNSALQPIKDDTRDIKLDIENDIKPQIQLLAENYVPAAKRYEQQSERIEDMKTSIDLMQKVIQEHSVMLHKLA